ncbi:MAG: HEAT repeat domain-containing protein [Isosphaeraceae bacterium]
MPAAYRGNLVSAQHNTRSVGRHVLVPAGATFRSEDSPLVSTEDPDFHPSDVLVEGDGSVLIIDTGAWYVQHCPTGRIRPSSSQGGLFRIVWPGSSRPDDPYGRKLDVASLGPDRLAALLGDPRPAVRALARRELARRGEPVLPALADLVARDRPKARRSRPCGRCPRSTRRRHPLLRRALRGGPGDRLRGGQGTGDPGRQESAPICSAASPRDRPVSDGRRRTPGAVRRSHGGCRPSGRRLTGGVDEILRHAADPCPPPARHRRGPPRAARPPPNPRCRPRPTLLDQSPRPKGLPHGSAGD